MKTYYFELRHNGRHHSFTSQRASSETTARAIIRQSLKGQSGWSVVSSDKEKRRGGNAHGGLHG
jgi:hypothetical protein